MKESREPSFVSDLFLPFLLLLGEREKEGGGARVSIYSFFFPDINYGSDHIKGREIYGARDDETERIALPPFHNAPVATVLDLGTGDWGETKIDCRQIKVLKLP